MNEFVKEVKSSKKYSGISDDVVLTEIKNYLSKNNPQKISKQDIKEVRSLLHKSYASFQTRKKNKIEIYLDELKKDTYDLEITDKLLGITLSTKERIDDYEDLYDEIFKMTGIPRTIVDLGGGFNIFSYPFMNLSALNYYSYDLDKKDMNIINDYIKIMGSKGLNGKADIIDLRNLKSVSELPSSDIIFLFKVIDLIDKENHKPSEGLLTYLFNNKKTKFIVASFATRTLTRKKMNYPKRVWFELMLKRNNLLFETIDNENEIFYIISPKKKS